MIWNENLVQKVLMHLNLQLPSCVRRLRIFISKSSSVNHNRTFRRESQSRQVIHQMPKKSSLTSALASIGRLLPKRKKHGGGSRRHRNRHDDHSFSSSQSSNDEVSCSDMSEGTERNRSPSRSEEDSRLDRDDSRGSQKGKSRRTNGSKHHRERDRNRGRRNKFYSPSSHGEYTTQRQRNAVFDDDATRMIDLLMRILPLYGRGDSKSDALVLDTIHSLPSHALEMKDVDGNTLLLLACQTGTYDLLPILLEKGCSVNARNNVGASCLHYACSMETFDPDIAMALIRHGALAEATDLQFHSTPLHWAAYSGHIELCAELCRSGAIPTTADRNGFDSIHYAKQNGHLACAQLLLSYTQHRDINSANSLSKSADWVRYIDDSTGAVFFHNIETGASVWGDPRIGDQGIDDHIPGQEVESSKTTFEPTVEQNDTVVDVAENVFQSPASQKLISANNTSSTDVGANTSKRATLHEVPGSFSRLDSLPNLAAIATKVVEEKFIPPSLGTVKSLRSPAKTLSPGSFSTRSLASSQLFEEKMSSRHKQMESQLMHRLQDLENKVMQHDVGLSHNKTRDDESTHAKENIADLMATIAKLQTEVSTKELEILSLSRRSAAKEVDYNLPRAHANVGDGDVRDNRMELKVSELVAASESQVLESANKDREIRSLREKVEELKAMRHLHLSTSVDSGVGAPRTADDIVRHAQELEDARKQISVLKDQVEEAKQSIIVANGRYEQARSQLDIAEQAARVEKASRSSAEALLEQSKSREVSDSALTQKLHEEKLLAEESARQLKGQLQMLENKSLNERNNHRQELERLGNKYSNEQSRASLLANELEKASSMHRSTIAEVHDQHTIQLGRLNEELTVTRSKLDVESTKVKELEEEVELQRVFNSKLKDSHELELGQLRAELDGTKTDLETVNSKLKEATIAKMELMVSKHDSDVAMENAVEKARLAESKLQKMTEFINRTEELKMSNDKLQISLQDQTEKRKLLHNTLEDLKGRIRVYVRVRPLSDAEIKANYRTVLTKEDEKTCVMAEDVATASDARDWEFDKIFCGSDVDGNTQEAVFKDTSLLITSAIDGFNVCIDSRDLNVST